MLVAFSMTTHPDIRLRHTRQLDAATRATIVELCTEAHQADFSRLFFHLPTDGLHFLAYRDDQIVSHVVVTTRWLQAESLPILRGAYVAALATLPAYQKRGYGGAILRELAGNITDYDIAYLEAEEVAFFLQRGWERWRGPCVKRAGDQLSPLPAAQNLLILRLPRTPQLDLDRTLTLESQAKRMW
ncbi:Aminoglycoside 2'-N-acetyltransferase [Thermoflexales bacterium]|nr:Aminoglycoside 2'-N-acetyltransferase [Thermoflexales bacterium]